MSQLFLPSSPDSPKSPTQNQFQDVPLRFSASMTQVSHLADILSAITSINSQALMIISDSGITFYAEYNHITNVQLTIDASLFSLYELSSPDSNTQTNSTQGPPREMRLGIDVQLVSDSFTAAASTVIPRSKGSHLPSGVEPVLCYLKYEGEGYPLVVEFEDRLMSEKIEFSTFYIETDYPYDGEGSLSELVVNHQAVQFELILKSDLLSNLLQDLQQINTQDLYMFVSNKDQRNQLNFISRGAIGYLKLIFPSAKTMLEKLDMYELEAHRMCPVENSVLSCFSFPPFIRIFKAVKLSSKCKIMKDLSGILSVQLLCKNPMATNYPGTLITFNMLEMSANSDEFGLKNVDVNKLFDDGLYQYIKEYDPISTDHQINQIGEIVQEPLSYASFKIANQERSEDEFPASKRQKNDTDKNDFTAVGGAVEVPLFL